MRRLYGIIRELKHWPVRGRPGREEALVRFVSSDAICGRVPRQREDHRSRAGLSRCTGSTLNASVLASDDKLDSWLWRLKSVR